MFGNFTAFVDALLHMKRGSRSYIRVMLRGRAHESLLPFARAGGVAREAAAALSGNERLDFHLVQTSLTRAARR